MNKASGFCRFSIQVEELSRNFCTKTVKFKDFKMFKDLSTREVICNFQAKPDVSKLSCTCHD